MIAEARNRETYCDYYEYITDEQTKEAFAYIVGLSATLKRYTCHPKKKSEALWDYRFYAENGDQDFAFIVNRGSLLFYFRLPTVREKYSLETIEATFDDVTINDKGEWKVRLRSIDDVRRLWRLLALSEAV